MAFTTAVKNAAVDNITAQGAKISLHTGDPGTTGANEATGGSYAKQTTTWGAAAAGVGTGSEVTFAGLVAAGYTHWGCWNTAGTTFLHGNTLSPSMTLGGTGTLKVTPTVTFP